MENKLIKEIKIENRLSIPQILKIFLNLATEHGTQLKVGMGDLSKNGLIWIVSKTKIHISNSNNTEDILSATTWPTAPGRIRCNRYYTIANHQGLIAEGKSEWAILDAKTGRPQKLETLYPKEINLLEETVCDEPFSKLNSDFTDAKVFAEYTVSLKDIDENNHMNNVEYVRAVLDHFPADLLENKSITDMEIHYKSQCFLNDKLTFKYNIADYGFEIRVLKSDNSVAVTMIVTIS